MSRFFLVSRIVILVALMILIFACFWGWFNQTHAQPIPEMSQLEKYSSKKPGPVTTVFFVVSIFLGEVIVSVSIWLEHKRVQSLEAEMVSQDPRLV
jgi:uncharacterized membrane protein